MPSQKAAALKAPAKSGMQEFPLFMQVREHPIFLLPVAYCCQCIPLKPKIAQNRFRGFPGSAELRCSGTRINTDEIAFCLDFGWIQESGFVKLIISSTVRMRPCLAIGATFTCASAVIF